MDNESVIDIRTSIVTKRIIEMLKGFEQFSVSFKRIDTDIQDELLKDLQALVDETMRDTTVKKDVLPDVIAEKIFDDLSDRRGLRQDFFNAMPRDDEHRALIEQKKSEDDLIEVGRPSPHLPPKPPKPIYIPLTHEELRKKIADLIRTII